MLINWKEKLKNKKFLHKVIAVSVIFILLLIAAVYTVFIKPNVNKESYIYKEEAVQKGDIVLGIMESGSVSMEEASLSYELELETSEEDSDEESSDGDDEEESIKYLEIEEVYVVSGQRINEGDVLFKLTAKSVEAVKKRLTSLKTKMQIALSEAETEFKIQSLEAKSTYDTSILEAGMAKTTYNSSQTRAQESINSLEADISVMEAEITYYNKQLEEEELWESLEDAQTKYTSAKNVYEDTDVHNGAAYASNYESYQSAKEQLDSIQEQIDTLREGIENNQKSIDKKRQEISETAGIVEIEKLNGKSDYDSAVQGGELAQEIYDYTVEALQETVSAAETDLEEAESNLVEFTSFVGDDATIYADGSGIVTNVLYEAGDSLVSTGSMLNYTKEDAYTVSIDVSEEDVPSVKVGDKVDIAMNAYTDASYEGTVISITTTAASDYASTVSYPVMIRIEGDTSKLYGGMTAGVNFITDSVSDVLYISKKAIQTVDGKTYVYVKGVAGKKKLTEVETGFSNGTNIEIVSGLSQGDTVYIESKINGNEKELTNTNTVGSQMPFEGADNENEMESNAFTGMENKNFDKMENNWQ